MEDVGISIQQDLCSSTRREWHGMQWLWWSGPIELRDPNPCSLHLTAAPGGGGRRRRASCLPESGFLESRRRSKRDFSLLCFSPISEYRRVRCLLHCAGTGTQKCLLLLTGVHLPVYSTQACSTDPRRLRSSSGARQDARLAGGASSPRRKVTLAHGAAARSRCTKLDTRVHSALCTALPDPAVVKQLFC